MKQKMGVEWHLRSVMATKGMFSTSDLVAPLAERGIRLSREQVYRLVVGTPQRLNLDVLATLCDILDCGVQDLIAVVETKKTLKKTAEASGSEVVKSRDIKPVRARIRRPDK